jgi:hypothetical protein
VFVNNLIFDWGYNSEFEEQGYPLKLDVVGNYWKPRTYSSGTELPISIDFDSSSTFGSQIFMVNNWSSTKGLFLTPAQIITFGGNAVCFSNVSLLNTSSTITTTDAHIMYDTVTAFAGALHPQRDTTDKRITKSVADSTGGLIDCISAIPMLLDSGRVISSTDSSLTYDQVFQNPAISPEGRKIVIVSGTGAGQTRQGISVNVIDSATRIIEAILDAPWTIRPDSTSHYQVISPCDLNLGGWPTYATGIAPIDSDQDGMPDSWEAMHNLNPNDPSDRNNHTLSSEGYTDLEVYLNSFYDKHGTNGIVETLNDPTRFQVDPNPFKESLHINFILDHPTFVCIKIVDLTGRPVDNVLSSVLNDGAISLLYDATKFSPGIYLLSYSIGSSSSYTKLVHIN